MEQYLLIFMSLFAAMNPLSSTPVFLSLTNKMTDDQKREVAKKSIFFSIMLGAAFFLFGKAILTVFGITIPAFQIGGGFIVFTIGLDMLRKKAEEPSIDEDDVGDVNIAISPLAVPLIIGPGAIATIISLSANTTWLDTLIEFLLFLILLLIMYLSFISAEKIFRYLGEQGIVAVTKIMGLILAIIGTQMVINGLQTLFMSVNAYL